MNAQHDSRLVGALVDDELDLTRRLDIEAQMRHDAALEQNVEGLRQLREAIREGADYHAAPAALRERIVGSAAPRSAASGRASAAVAGPVRRGWRWRPLVASFAAMVVLAVLLDLAWLRSLQGERVLDEVVASHVRSTLGQHLVDVASSDHHTVKPWLSSRLDFSPPVDALQIPGSVFLGARVDYLDGRPVAALVYRQGAHIVNSFVWPAGVKDSPPEFAQRRGFQAAHWSSRGMTHWVISDVNRDEFAAVVGAIRAADVDR